MSGSATLTTVPSRKAMPDPSTAIASTQRPAALWKASCGIDADASAKAATIIVEPCFSTTPSSRATATRSVSCSPTSGSPTSAARSRSPTAPTGPSCWATSTRHCACPRSCSMTAARWPNPTRSSATSPRARATSPTTATSARRSCNGCSSSSTATSPTSPSSASGSRSPTRRRRRPSWRPGAAAATPPCGPWRATSPSARVPGRRALHHRRHRPLRLHPRRARGRLRPRALPGGTRVAGAGGAQPGHVGMAD